MASGARHISDYITDEKTRLLRWLALELAPTIFGNKPSTILSLSDIKCMPTLSLWQRFGTEIMQDSVIDYFVLRQTPQNVVVLFYHRESLERCLKEICHRKFLQRCGYRVEDGLEQCLVTLKKRFQYSCPHEIGLLLGIPLKDVLGFMGLGELPLTCKGLWHVYGDPECSLATMRCFSEDRRLMEECLVSGYSPLSRCAGV